MALWILACCFGKNADAQQPISLLRDAEIEETLKLYAAPFFKQAGLNAAAVKVHLVHDDGLNAFVANGQNLFVNTGLLLKSETAAQVKGVFAHEVGHLSGGHLARFQEERSSLSVPTIASYLLGAAAAAAGSPQAGIAVIAGAAGVRQQTLLRYSRTQENAADQAAVTAFKTLKMSPQGLLEIMRILEGEAMWRKKPNPYQQTHPALSERINFLENAAAHSLYKNVVESAEIVQRHALMRGKIEGFLSAPQIVLQQKGADIKTLYAKAIAAYRLADIPAGDGYLMLLEEKVPPNAYFDEVRGQMRVEAGRVREGLVLYQKAFAAKKEAPLLALAVGKTLLALDETTDNAKKAQGFLEKITQAEPENSEGWHWLGMAFARQGKEGMASLCLAEKAFRQHDTQNLRLYTERAAAQLPPKGAAALRLADLKKVLEEEEKVR